ncbi:MAG TPA: hypothetical protein PLU53_01825 [Bacteroidia bacterium]|nr:hypothetical protein [Bacteroidia bacterium]HRH65014.1 hypothetical protein [Bacteroidia bacterium]
MKSALGGKAGKNVCLPDAKQAGLLKIFEQGGEKQTIKSVHQLWQYNSPACIALRQAGMQKKFTVRNSPFRKSNTFIITL